MPCPAKLSVAQRMGVREGIFRIRKRGSGEDAVYIKTVKIKINDLKRIEKETYLTKSEYTDLLNRKECITGIISKDRYCIVYDDSYYELDVYPFWKDRAETGRTRVPSRTSAIRLQAKPSPYGLEALAIDLYTSSFSYNSSIGFNVSLL